MPYLCMLQLLYIFKNFLSINNIITDDLQRAQHKLRHDQRKKLLKKYIFRIWKIAILGWRGVQIERNEKKYIYYA